MNESGIIMHDVAVGAAPILSLMNLASANGIACSTTEVKRDQVMTEARV